MDRACELFPESGQAEILLGVQRLRAGQTSKGLAHLTDVRNRRPQQAVAIERTVNVEGYRLLQEGRHRQALLLFQTNTKWFPKSANAWDSLGEAQRTADEAADIFL